MLEKLGNMLKKATDKIANAIFLDKNMVEGIIKDLQRALIEADVNIHLVKKISDELRQKALDERIKGVKKKEEIIKTLHDKLLELIGGEKHELVIEKGKKQKIILLGLYGSGKTTTTAKLANYYSKRGLKTCILGLDVHRPAAREQLEQLGKQNNIKVFVDKEEQDPIKTYKKFQEDLENYDLTIIDTAGRHSLDKELVKEITDLGKKIKPDYVLLVISADIGQAAKTQASEFQKALAINGVIVTKMDSTAKGGGALTACSETKAPVFFITVGEKVNDLETFNPQTFIERILGMGDLQALLEKVSLVVDEKKQEEARKKLQEGKFTLKDLAEQLESMEKVSTLDKITELIPGLGKAKIPEGMLGNQQNKMKKWKHAISSMTEEEVENPELIEKSNSRLQRIAKGSGTNTSDIRALLKQYKMIKEFMKSGKDLDMSSGNMSQAQMMKLAKKFGKKMRI